MSFNTSLSGLNSASKDLGVTSNNIANANSTGFKKSRTEFGDIYAVSAFGNSKTATGQGVTTQVVSQQFVQGNMQFTDSGLDLAITGSGFFAVAPNLTNMEFQYTRSGGFGINKDGYVVNNSGQYLMTLPVNKSDGTVSSTALSTAQPLLVPASSGVPRPTTEVELGVNVPADAVSLNVNNFDPTEPTTYTNATSVTIYDSLGDSHILTSYFVKDDTASNSWAVFQFVDGQKLDLAAPAGTTGAGYQYAAMTFNTDGTLSATNPATITSLEYPAVATPLPNGADPLVLTLDLVNNKPTQFANLGFVVNKLSQDGATTGRLSGLTIGEDGLVRANYSNGDSEALGKVLMADFRNPQGLKQVGNNSWVETIDSGTPLVGEAGTGRFGLIQSGALEASNVDLTAELVNLITAQRNFQANAKAIEANKALSDTIINIR
ncbi:MAG: flagellar hook protein FlgE [Pseudomonadota bacterium]